MSSSVGLVTLNALVLTGLVTFRAVGNSDMIQKKTTFWEVETVPGVFAFLSAFKRSASCEHRNRNYRANCRSSHPSPRELIRRKLYQSAESAIGFGGRLQRLHSTGLCSLGVVFDPHRPYQN
jgi:hypothetical protein